MIILMISMNMNRLLRASILHRRLFSTLWKLPYGQGGSCQLNLLKNNYNIKCETIWQDECRVELENKPPALMIEENGSIAIISDHLQTSHSNDAKVDIRIQMPQDYTFSGKINGNMKHATSRDSNKLRSNSFRIELLGDDRSFIWKALSCPEPTVCVPTGTIDIDSLTFENGHFICQNFLSRKLMFSGKLNIEAKQSLKVRSIVTAGTAKAHIQAGILDIESISGQFDIEANSVSINRVWASPQGIKIKCKKVVNVGIETGSGYIEADEPIERSKISMGTFKMGKARKGTITYETPNKVFVSVE